MRRFWNQIFTWGERGESRGEAAVSAEPPPPPQVGGKEALFFLSLPAPHPVK